MRCLKSHLQDDVEDAVQQRVEAADEGTECHGLQQQQ